VLQGTISPPKLAVGGEVGAAAARGCTMAYSCRGVCSTVAGVLVLLACIHACSSAHSAASRGEDFVGVPSSAQESPLPDLDAQGAHRQASVAPFSTDFYDGTWDTAAHASDVQPLPVHWMGALLRSGLGGCGVWAACVECGVLCVLVFGHSSR
jgi:hypothetical protein